MAGQPHWFQSFLLHLILEALSARTEKRQATNWLDFAPPEHLETLRKRRGLKQRYAALVANAKRLTIAQANGWKNHLAAATCYSQVLGGSLPHPPAPGSKEQFDDAVRSLFEFSFSLLGELPDTAAAPVTIRDAMYERLYQSMPAAICPFCGLDHFDPPHPDMPRNAFDHYLAISRYPAFGAHLPNLVPMCARCNSSYKRDQDMLFDANRLARPCLDPYGTQVAKISLMNSSPFGGANGGQLPAWKVEFLPNLSVFETWDSVFKVRLRYSKSVLDSAYNSWLDAFSKWVKDGAIDVSDNESASKALLRWSHLSGGLRDLEFLKRPMFEMLSAVVAQPTKDGARLSRLIVNMCAM